MEASTIAIVGLSLTIIGLIATHFRTKGVADLDNRVVKLEARFEMYLDFQERYNAQILHRDDDREKVDKLLEQREELNPLPPKEDKRLDETLEQIINDRSQSMGRRAAAAQMLAARKARDREC